MDDSVGLAPTRRPHVLRIEPEETVDTGDAGGEPTAPEVEI